MIKNPNYRLRAITRDPSKDGARALVERGVEVIRADLNDIDSLRSAFSGAYAIYAYTNFFDTPFISEDIYQASEKLEAQQAKNAALAAAETPTLEHYIWSSTPNAIVQSAGKHDKIRFFNSKSRITGAIKEEMPGLWAKTTEIWIGFM